MVFVSYLLLILVTIAGSISLYYIFKKFDNKKGMILKVLSLVLALVITIRYMLGEGAISTTRGLNMFTPFNDDIYKTVISVLLIWFSYASILMLILNSFFKINNAKNFVKFFSLPVLLLDVIFFKWY